MDKRRVSLVLVFVMIISVIRPYVWYGENASQKKMTAKAATVEVWDGSVDTSWYDREAKSFKISNASQLAGLAQLVNRGETMYGKKIGIGEIMIHGEILHQTISGLQLVHISMHSEVP